MWAIGVKNGVVVTGGLNLVIDGTFNEFIPVPENVAKQIEKIEYIGNGQYKVKEGQTLLTTEELNALKEDFDDDLSVVEDTETIEIVEPIKEDVLWTEITSEN